MMLNIFNYFQQITNLRPYWALSLVFLCCGSYSVSYAQNDLSVEVVRTTGEQSSVGGTSTFKVRVVNQGLINFGYNTYPTTGGTLPRVAISIPAGLQLNSIGAYPITTYATYAGGGTVTATNASIVYTDATPANLVSSAVWTLDATAVGLLNANQVVEITMSFTTRAKNLATGALNSGEGVHTLKAEITQSVTDIDSTPNNGLSEDDVAFACITVPYEFCFGSPRNVLLTANAGFVGVSSSTITPASVTPMVNIASLTNVTYQWARSTDNGATYTNIAGATSATYTVTGTSTGYYRYTITYDNPTVGQPACSMTGCCPLIIVDVPNPTLAAISPQTICLNQSATLTAVASNGTTPYTYSWTNPTNGGLSGTTGASVTATPTAAGSFSYPVTVTDSYLCTATTTALVTVNARPTVTSSATATVCSSIALNYTITSSLGGTTYNWTRAAVAGISNAAATNQTTNPITETLVNTTSAPIVVTYSITPTATSCSGSAFTLSVTVNPSPTVSSAATATVCSGTAMNYDITSATAGATFSWSRAAVAGISNAALSNQSTDPITETLVNTTASPITVTYTITATANGCAGPSFTLTVTVNPSPTVSSAATATVCSGTAMNYDITSATAGATFSWSRAAVAGISNAALSSQSTDPITETLVNTTANPINVTYTITATANGCAGPSFTLTVTVNPSPTVSSAATATVCSGTAMNYDITSATAGATFSWSRAAVVGISNAALSNQSTDPITETLVNTTASPITVTYTITATANGCAGPSFTLTVTVNPSPTISSAATATVCSGTAMNYDITSATAGATFSWSRAAVAGISNAAASNQSTDPITETLVNTTANPITVTYTITATANGCAGPSFTLTVTVNPSPTVSSAATATVCSGTAMNYDITSATAGATFSWSRAAVAGISNAAASNQSTDPITETLVNTTANPITVTYTITATANGCAGPSFTLTVTVNPSPTVSSAATATVCSGTAMNYDITSATAGATFSWSRAAVAGISNAAASNQSTDPITETLVNTTASPITVTYTITATANGCAGPSFTLTVTVNPTATISSAASKTICSNTSVAYTITSATAGTTYNWSRAAVVGISNVAATNQTTNPIAEVLVNITSSPITVTYTITPTANGCTGTVFNFTVVVNPVPTANAGPDVTICAGTGTLIGSANVVGNTYLWSPTTNLSSSTVSNPTATPTTTTTYTVTVTATAGGCTAVDAVIVTVNPRPTVNAGPDVSICNGTSTTLNAVGSGGTGALSYFWSPSTGLSSTSIANPVANPTTIGANTYTVIITDINGCTNTDVVVVTVQALPNAGTNGTSTACKTDIASSTIDLSTRIGTFDPGGTWTAATFTTTNTGATTYTVPAAKLNASTGVFTYTGMPATTYVFTYTVTNAAGCSKSSTVTVTINTCCPPAICLPMSSTRN